MSDQPKWKLTLPQYLGNSFVETSSKVFDEEFIIKIRQSIFHFERNDFIEAPHHWRDDIVFLTREKLRNQICGSVIVECRRTGQRIGGSVNGYQYVIENRRCRGVGSEIVYFGDLNSAFSTKITRYSLENFECHKSAHALHIKRALQNGLGPIPKNVMEWYGYDDFGNIILSRPWSFEQHNERAMRKRINNSVFNGMNDN